MVAIRTILAGMLLNACASGPMGKPCGGSTGHACARTSDTIYEDNVWMPKFERRQVVRGDAVDGLDVDIQPLGVAAWTIRVKSATGGTLLWDESSFVGSNSASAGRLIPGETTRMDLGRSHPPSPLPTNAVVSESVFVEKLIDEEELEQKMPTYSTKQRVAETVEHRKQLATFVESGTINLVIQVGGEKKTWIGHVEHIAEKAPPTASGE